MVETVTSSSKNSYLSANAFLKVGVSVVWKNSFIGIFYFCTDMDFTEQRYI